MKNFLALTAIVLASTIGFSQPASRAMTKLGQFTYLQNINDVWGYESQNREYALVGVEDGLSIVEVTNPQNLVEKLFVPGANSTWRDMKTYQNYAYTVHDRFSGTSDGILVVDMSTLDNTFPTFWNRIPTIPYQGNSLIYQRAHNLYIDENGFLYLFGTNIGQGGALIFDLKPDPTDPTFVGIFDQYYLHDGVVRGDTLWGAAVTQGFFSAVSVLSKTSPAELGRQSTPNGVSHNVWFSDDNQRVFTTDETRAAFVAEYDVSDLNNITELDRIRTSLSTNVVPHNAHFYNNFLVNSYYTSGVQIVDVSVPGIMVETAYYDTSPSSGDGFTGAWGAYPYLPSGKILVSDREQGLFVLSSTYPRATYLVATVVNAQNSTALINANVQVLNGSINANTSIFGTVREGQAQAGNFNVVVSKAGFVTDTFPIILSPSQVSTYQFPLQPVGIGLTENSAEIKGDVYPNPSNSGNFILTLPQTVTGWYNYELITATGAILKQGEIENTGEDHYLEWALTPGYYFFTLISNKGLRQNIPLVVQ
jgi:choice-of-anchor B domain-containing protein